jgi:hypothetical protein
LEKLTAELSIKIKKDTLNETEILNKWQQLIKDYQCRGIDVKDSSLSTTPETIQSNEICVILQSGEQTQSPDYKEMYALLGEFLLFLYQEMFYVGPVNISLERKCLVFEIQTQLP